jgi:hypothetical protein
MLALKGHLHHQVDARADKVDQHLVIHRMKRIGEVVFDQDVDSFDKSSPELRKGLRDQFLEKFAQGTATKPRDRARAGVLVHREPNELCKGSETIREYLIPVSTGAA